MSIKNNNRPEKEGPDNGDARDEQGRFRRGRKGGGRPKGSPNKVTQAVRAMIGEHAEEVTAAMITKALSGNVAAGAALLRAVVPPPKEADKITFALPKLREAADAISAIDVIAAGLARGELDPAAVRALLAVVGGFVGAVQTLEQEQRIAALESALEARP